MDTYVAKPYVAEIDPAPEWRHKLDLLCLQIRVRPVDIVDAEADAADADVLEKRIARIVSSNKASMSARTKGRAPHEVQDSGVTSRPRVKHTRT